MDAEKLRRARMMEDLMLGRGEIGGPFTLTDHTGARRSLANTSNPTWHLNSVSD